MRPIACVAGVVLLTSVGAQAEEKSTKEVYELAERCGKRTEELFRRDWGDSGVVQSKGTTIMASYTNHYNTKLNKCFERLTTNMATAGGIITTFEISDVNEQRVVATYSHSYENNSKAFKPGACFVDGQPCNSQDEWESQIGHYMND